MVSLLVKGVLATDFDASVAETRISTAGGNSALIDKFRTALANAGTKAAAQVATSGRASKPATRRLSKAMIEALQHAVNCEDDPTEIGVNYAPLNSIRTGTCVALLDRSLLDYVRDPERGDAVVGHRATSAGRQILDDIRGN